jgi:hypothetical protein
MKILYTFLTEKKKLFWINKKFVYLIFINKLWWYHPKITHENIIKKDMNKFVKTMRKIAQIFVAFSEKLNFKAVGPGKKSKINKCRAYIYSGV